MLVLSVGVGQAIPSQHAAGPGGWGWLVLLHVRVLGDGLHLDYGFHVFPIGAGGGLVLEPDQPP